MDKIWINLDKIWTKGHGQHFSCRKGKDRLIRQFCTFFEKQDLGVHPNPDRNSQKRSLCSLQNAIWNGICNVNINCKINENKTIHSWSCNRRVGGL